MWYRDIPITSTSSLRLRMARSCLRGGIPAPGGAYVSNFGRVAAAGATVTAIARYPFHLDVFTVGTDNRVYSCWWDERSGGPTGSRSATRAAGLIDSKRGGPLSRPARSFSPQGRMERSYRRGGMHALAGAHGFPGVGRCCSAGSPVTAISRYSNHLDLFVIGTDNRIYSTRRHDTTGWAFPGLMCQAEWGNGEARLAHLACNRAYRSLYRRKRWRRLRQPGGTPQAVGRMSSWSNLI